MYTPASFALTDRSRVRETIEAYPFGELITIADGRLQITHLPVAAQERGGELVLFGHVARANPHARAIASGERATAVFTGPHAFVSASWYEAPYETVPTWNYVAIHASGRLRETDPMPVLALLTQAFESGRWRVEGLEIDAIEKQLRGIVAFELAVEELDAKAKLSQNRTRADRERVIAALAASPRELDRACAQAMQAALDGDG